LFNQTDHFDWGSLRSAIYGSVANAALLPEPSTTWDSTAQLVRNFSASAINGAVDKFVMHRDRIDWASVAGNAIASTLTGYLDRNQHTSADPNATPREQSGLLGEMWGTITAALKGQGTYDNGVRDEVGYITAPIDSTESALTTRANPFASRLGRGVDVADAGGSGRRTYLGVIDDPNASSGAGALDPDFVRQVDQENTIRLLEEEQFNQLLRESNRTAGTPLAPSTPEFADETDYGALGLTNFSNPRNESERRINATSEYAVQLVLLRQQYATSQADVNDLYQQAEYIQRNGQDNADFYGIGKQLKSLDIDPTQAYNATGGNVFSGLEGLQSLVLRTLDARIDATTDLNQKMEAVYRGYGSDKVASFLLKASDDALSNLGTIPIDSVARSLTPYYGNVENFTIGQKMGDDIDVLTTLRGIGSLTRGEANERIDAAKEAKYSSYAGLVLGGIGTKLAGATLKAFRNTAGKFGTRLSETAHFGGFLSRNVALALAKVSGVQGQVNRVNGKIGEYFAMRAATKRGEIIIPTQHGGNKGFDFFSVAYDNGEPRLILNEVKNWSSKNNKVRAGDLTAFGLGKKPGTLDDNIDFATKQIVKSNLPRGVKTALVDQLEQKNVTVRLLGGSKTRWDTGGITSALQKLGYNRVDFPQPWW
jgi:hypothetical protein